MGVVHRKLSDMNSRHTSRGLPAGMSGSSLLLCLAYLPCIVLTTNQLAFRFCNVQPAWAMLRFAASSVAEPSMSARVAF